MKIKELRIGNIVYVFNKQIAEIATIGYDGCWVNLLEPEEYQSYSHDIESSYIEPIQLTEEWLVKMGGFKGQYIWHFNGMSLDQLSKSKEYFLSINNGEYIEGVAIKHVHSLQNLYFALTGEELKINLVV